MNTLVLRLGAPIFLMIGILGVMRSMQLTDSDFEIITHEEHEEIKKIMQDLENAERKAAQEEKVTGFFSGLSNALINMSSGVLWKPQENKPFWDIITTHATVKKSQRILLVSLHGTFANTTEAGQLRNTQDGSPEYKNSLAIRNYAQWLADTYGHDVDLLMYQWAAGNTEALRATSGEALAQEIIKYIGKNAVPLLFSVTHSWGGAVMQYAAKKLYGVTGLNFDLGIQTACPVPHNETSSKVYHFKKLFQFYSNADLTQVMGSTATFTQNFGRKMPVKLGQDTLVWNVRVQEDGQELNHINIKWIVMEHASELITTIQKEYPHQFDLDANIMSADKFQEYKNKYDLPAPVLVAVRDPKVGFLDQVSQKQKTFNTYNQDLFQKIYGRSIHDKSSFLKRQLNILVKSPLYLIFYANEDALGKQELEKPSTVSSSRDGSWIFGIENNTSKWTLQVNVIKKDMPPVVFRLGVGGVLYLPVDNQTESITFNTSGKMWGYSGGVTILYSKTEQGKMLQSGKSGMMVTIVDGKLGYGKTEQYFDGSFAQFKFPEYIDEISKGKNSIEKVIEEFKTKHNLNDDKTACRYIAMVPERAKKEETEKALAMIYQLLPDTDLSQATLDSSYDSKMASYKKLLGTCFDKVYK